MRGRRHGGLYEAEYDNRARVPEHPAIMARWSQDAAAYREHMKAEENAELGLAYGTSERQKRRPVLSRRDRPHPLAMFIHGGYWRALDHAHFSHMAKGLNARGVAVAVAGYDRSGGLRDDHQPIQQVEVDDPEADRDRQHQPEDLRDAGVAPVEGELEPEADAQQHRDRHHQLHDRRRRSTPRA